MAALTPVVFDFLEFFPALQSLVLDSMGKIATTTPYLSRSVGRAWREEVKRRAYQHSDWENMVRSTLSSSYTSERTECI